MSIQNGPQWMGRIPQLISLVYCILLLPQPIPVHDKIPTCICLTSATLDLYCFQLAEHLSVRGLIRLKKSHLHVY